MRNTCFEQSILFVFQRSDLYNVISMKRTPGEPERPPRRALRIDNNTTLTQIRPRANKYKKNGSPRDPTQTPSQLITLQCLFDSCTQNWQLHYVFMTIWKWKCHKHIVKLPILSVFVKKTLQSHPKWAGSKPSKSLSKIEVCAIRAVKQIWFEQWSLLCKNERGA